MPFCLLGRPAWVTGWGQRIQPLSDLPDFSLVLVHPRLQLSTRRVFDALSAPAWRAEAEKDSGNGENAGDRDDKTSRPLRGSLPLPLPARVHTPGVLPSRCDTPRTLPELCALVENDLWPVALSLHPELSIPWEALARQRPLAQGMSGSGPTLFGIFADPRQAGAAASALVRDGLVAHATRPL